MRTLWIALACILATLAAGFGLGGWVTSGTALRMAAEAAESSRRQLAMAVCVEQFLGASDLRAHLEKLRNARWSERDDFIAAGGWATMPDREEPDNVVAIMCAAQLSELQARSAVE